MAVIVLVTRDLLLAGRVHAWASQQQVEAMSCAADDLGGLASESCGRVLITDDSVGQEQLSLLKQASGALAVLLAGDGLAQGLLVRQSLKASSQPDGCLPPGCTDAELGAELERLIGLANERLTRQKNVDRVRQDVVAMVDSLAQVLEVRDPYTAGHSIRVAAFSQVIARGLGLDEAQLAILEHGAALHDIGKIAIRREVLHKGGVLTDEEFEHIKLHPVIAREILEPVAEFAPVLEVVYHHHERIDGRGYPDGLKGDEIPLLAQIVAVADTFDAMTSDRPYRAGMPALKALRLMEEVAGTQLNPRLVGILAEHIRGEVRHSA